MTTAPPLAPPPADLAPPRAPRRSDRFFAWIVGLGVVRADGWIGGVAGGVAARLRIDPLIVRGILVVATLFGLPMLFVYAVAWALLPDQEGRIHLRGALRGRFDPALFGILGAAVLSLAPTTGILILAVPLLGLADLPALLLLALALGVLGVLLTAFLLFLIVRAAHRAPGSPDLRQASAASADPVPPAAGSGPATAEADAVALAMASASLPSSVAAAPPVVTAPVVEPGPEGRDETQTETRAAEPPAPTPEASADDLAAWRAQHSAWKEQEQAWRRQQQDAERLAREQARAERREQSAAYSAAAAEHRRVRRLTNPRASAAFVAVVIGVAIVAAALTTLAGAHELAVAVGLFTAALIVAAGMLVAGVARRRSGFLPFMAVLLLVSGLVATAVPVAAALHVGGYGVSNLDGARQYPADAPFRQPWGDLSLYVEDTGVDGEWHVVKRTGTTWITARPGVALDLEITTSGAWLDVLLDSQLSADSFRLLDLDGVTAVRLPDGRMRYSTVVALDDAPITTRQRIVLDQDLGGVQIRLWSDEDHPTLMTPEVHRGDPTTPSPTATPADLEGAIDG